MAELMGSEVTEAMKVAVSEAKSQLSKLNLDIHSHPELCYQEHYAHDTIVKSLESLGFPTKPHAYDVPTSFEAEYGTGGRLVVFNAEYDALPGIGHACGHNLILTASVAGFLAAAAALKQSGKPGRVRILGTPAEEGGCGKGLLISRGAYKGVDACVMAHPTNMTAEGKPPSNGIVYNPHVGTAMFSITVRGKASHAAASPWNGHNALDAVVGGYVHVSMMRHALFPAERVHGIITNGGAKSNIVPDFASVNYGVRAPGMERIAFLRNKVIDCYKAGAAAAGCDIELEDHTSYVPMIPNKALAATFADAMSDLGVPMEFDVNTTEVKAGATDQGNVTFVVPAIHPNYDIQAPKGATNHTIGFTAAAGTDFAFERTLVVGLGLARSAWVVLTDDKVADEMKAEFEADKDSRRSFLSEEEELQAVINYDKESFEKGEVPIRPGGNCSCNHD
ncbi:hypothetical protein PFICI_09136 [Pestalotiopsis fici W106-1]|uniref:Peptidase M20 domain-containing protein 2 n=1 Tax=Pestalotiopsis fici (strain W106-1 / CGMCC3.15140) TaxID=1229662 RepID=W3WZI6_PESFW|nr:uncharacterized protein PFICI_09136 [Pestalotiopsis fici W106-1]ETS79283.1 hypothetical protein PFICI_09136 [Pestalotiopsis fici W106-1]